MAEAVGARESQGRESQGQRSGESQEQRSGESGETREQEAGVASPTAFSPFHRGAPAAIGVPLFIVGSIALGLNFINFSPVMQVGTPIAVIFAATGLFQVISAIWCIGLGENIVASIFGIFAGFWLSYAVLVLGLLHNWWGITPAATASKTVVAADTLATTKTVELFLISWLVVIIALTVTTLRLPLAFTVLFVLVDVSLVLKLIGTIEGTQIWNTAAGIVVFAFAAIGLLIYLDTMSQAFGAKPVALGKPIQR